LSFLAFCCLKKRRQHVEDEQFVKSSEYNDSTLYDIQDAPVAGFAPGAAHRPQQNYQYTDGATDPWDQQGFTRQRTVRYPVGSYGYHQQQLGQVQYDNPNLRDGDYVGHPTDKYEDPSNYHNPNTFVGSHPGAAVAGGVGAAAAATAAYGHRNDNSQYQQQHLQTQNPDQYDYRAQTNYPTPGDGNYYGTAQPQPTNSPDSNTTGTITEYSSARQQPAADGTISQATTRQQVVSAEGTHIPEATSNQPAASYNLQLPPPHGLDRNWDLYNYAAYNPQPSNNDKEDN